MFTGGGTPAWMIYQEAGTTPSNMATAHRAMGVGALKGSTVTTADAKKAYIQSDIDVPGRPRTWVCLPKSLWPKSWFNADGSPKYRDPGLFMLCGGKSPFMATLKVDPIWDKKIKKCAAKCGFIFWTGHQVISTTTTGLSWLSALTISF